MKLAFSTNAFTRYSLSQAIHAIAQAGYQGVEILADAPHAWPGAIDADFTRSVVADLNSTGLAVSNINCNCSFGYWKDAPPEPYFEPSLISPDPRHRADRIALILKTIDFAREIGARNISITSGRCLAGMPPEAAAKQFAESIKTILDQADRAGVDVGIECEPGLLLEWAEELRQWIDRLNHPRFGANLDIGHSEVMGESIPGAIKLLSPKIWNLHVEDIPRRKHYHMIPGEASIDWTGFRDVLWDVKYDRFATVELYTHTADPHAAAKKSFEFLSQLFGAP